MLSAGTAGKPPGRFASIPRWFENAFKRVHRGYAVSLDWALASKLLVMLILGAVVLLNVLEHIQDHEGALRQLYRILKPGGVVIIEVPAGPHLRLQLGPVLPAPRVESQLRPERC